MPGYDALHDYRPDDEFPIESHLWDEARLPDSAVVAEGVLTGYHEKFCFAAETIGEIPLADSLAEDPEAVKAAWGELSHDDRIAEIQTLGRYEIDAILKALLADKPPNKDGKKVDKLADEAPLRPYLERLLRLSESWFELKDRYFENPASKDENILWALVNFRTAYIDGMVFAFRELPLLMDRVPLPAEGDPRAPLAITAKMVGSLDITSDYDLTFGGPDDVPAVAEVMRAIRDVWGRESGTLFDSNFCFRDWAPVKDQLAEKWGKTLGTDPSFQVEVLEPIGDIGGLAKIRRYTSRAEWTAFVEAVQRDVTIDGLPVKNAPRFRRLDLVDEVFTKLYVLPALKRSQECLEAWANENPGREVKQTPRMLEHLLHEYPDAVLRATNLAYVELGAKLRDDEKTLRAKPELTSEPKAKFRQVKAGKVVFVDSGFNLEGLLAFIERSSVLLSEAVLFANEAYNTQGSLWDIVLGKQGGEKSPMMNADYFLQSFNEQVGDALKELRHHLRESEHRDAVKAAEAALAESKKKDDEALEKVFAAHDKFLQAKTGAEAVEARRERETLRDEWHALHEAYWQQHQRLQEELEAYGAGVEAQTSIGYYRASKYENRMKEVLQKIVKDLEADPSYVKRQEVYAKLFPRKKSPDAKDLFILKKEYLMSMVYDNHIREMLKIRKGASPYDTYTSEQKQEEADALVQQVLKAGTAFSDLKKEPDRKIAEPVFPEGSKYAVDESPSEDDPDRVPWGLRHLIKHLLWHCALVNKLVRKIKSRGPMDLYVRNVFVQGQGMDDDAGPESSTTATAPDEDTAA